MLGHFDGGMSYLMFRFHQAVAVRFLGSRLRAKIPELKSPNPCRKSYVASLISNSSSFDPRSQ